MRDPIPIFGMDFFIPKPFAFFSMPYLDYLKELSTSIYKLKISGI
jgi:hypothetical protein